MTTAKSDQHDSLVSRDGVVIGPIVGIHRDPVSHAARWAVVRHRRRRLLAPMSAAVTEPGRVQVPHDSDRIVTSPTVPDPTRLAPGDESRLAQHYAVADPQNAAAASGPLDAPAPDAESEVSVIRSEERLAVTSLEWRPYQRVRLRTVIRSREETHVVVVRWEELVVENEPVSAVERLEVSAGLSRPDPADIELVLHREEVTVTTRVVPYEWVRATRAAIVEEVEITDTVGKESIEIQHETAETRSSRAWTRQRMRR